jgi:hypothetical protein
MRVAALTVVGLGAVTAANNFGLSEELNNQIEGSLRQNCGDKCVNFWDEVQKSSSADESLDSALKREMEDKQTKFGQLEQSLTSFAQGAPLDVPCFDQKSCAIVEASANGCEYGRLAAMSVYQGLNVAAHTFGVVTKAVCACVDVYTASYCMLRKANPWPCESVSKVYENLLGASSSTWQAVKSTTSSCKAVGDVRAAVSFLERPVLNLHVAETHNSFLQDDFSAAKSAASYYSSMMDAGGDAGRRGVIGLLKLAAMPNAKAIMNLSTIVFKASRLAKRESTPDATRDLALSLVSYITNMPIAVQSSDAATGSYGHTNIVVPSPSRVYGPDRVLANLNAGAHAADAN